MEQMLMAGFLLASATLILFLILYVATQANRSQVTTTYVVLQGLVLGWTILRLLEVVAPEGAFREALSLMQYGPIAFMAPVFLVFAYAHTLKSMPKLRWILLLLAMPSTVYAGMLLEKGEGVSTWIMLGTSLLCFGLGNSFFLVPSYSLRSRYKKQNLLFVVATLLVPFSYSISAADLFEMGKYTPVMALPLSLLLTMVAILKYQFLDLMPQAMATLLETMEEGMLVVNEGGRIIDCTPGFFTFLPALSQGTGYGHFIQQLRGVAVDKRSVDSLSYAVDAGRETVLNGEIHIRTERREKTLRYTAKAIAGLYGNKAATLVTFWDVTSMIQLSRDLEDKNRAMEEANKRLRGQLESIQAWTVEKERNRILQEFHHTLGHSMAELLALLEVAELQLQRDAWGPSAKEALEAATDRARQGLSEIRMSVGHYKKTEVGHDQGNGG
ncbi:histidine kinase N-terminal 7TM domain-containing protein [Anaerotalea alkaliphila]|uniref:Histidine kinase n=1 Tax=Anaerotalea alkaliphila TaxID=2662126 RepID=A0A7X5HU38_9FIRM|nr:histidine kinase N-terminal 7TM domain-containing protein [Anaerotalea alkaliphila]NDL66698.1 hypothetical protein [Anaerotalea alkaliphila]